MKTPINHCYGGIMETVKILIPNSEAVSDFVNKTSSLPFDVDLGSGNRLVDAKSLLGVLYLGVGRITELFAPKEKMTQVEEKLREYLVMA